MFGYIDLWQIDFGKDSGGCNVISHDVIFHTIW